MPYRVHATMDAMNEATEHHSVDLSAIEPEPYELPIRDHAVLFSRQNGQTSTTLFTFFTHTV